MLNVHGNPVEEKREQSMCRGIVLRKKLGDCEFVYASVPSSVPFMPNEQTLCAPIEDQSPNVFIGWGRPSCAAVELAFQVHRALHPISAFREV
jgi:hypothetical protein